MEGSILENFPTTEVATNGRLASRPSSDGLGRGAPEVAKQGKEEAAGEAGLA